jgi:hypothetical protein
MGLVIGLWVYSDSLIWASKIGLFKFVSEG